jgi:hypothetical protein
MKHFLLFSAALFLFLLNGYGQDSLKRNPIIYGELGGGFAIGGIGGLEGNFNLNYQVKKSLFTLRILGVADLAVSPVETSPFTYLPGLENTGSLTEYGALYGWRFIDGGHSFSFSAGASLTDRTFIYRMSNHQKVQIESKFIGLPFEANVLWFKSHKSRYRLYHIIPIGKPTGFGSSIGFKLAGNVSQHSYLTLGLVLGLGYHKQY